MNNFIIYEPGDKDGGQPTTFSIELCSGQTFRETYTAVDKVGAPVDITGYTIRMQVRRSANAAALVSLAIGDGLTVTGNELTVNLTTAHTKAIKGKSISDCRFEKDGVVFYGLRFDILCDVMVTRE